MIGERFGRLVVTSEIAERTRHRRVRYLCSCDCGITVAVIGAALRSGNTSSCGCYKRESTRKRRFRHGRDTKDRTYRIWGAMRFRCSDKSPKRHRYKDRGIEVCARWDDFETFLIDMGEAPPGMSLGRIDNDAGYCPENCRWETPHQQSRNTGGNVWLSHNGVVMCLSDWAMHIGVQPEVLTKRLRRGWTESECIEGKRHKSRGAA